MNDKQLKSLGLIDRARYIATKAHNGQKRKYTEDSYILHPEAVAKMVRVAGGKDEMIAAAWLHDVVEDTPYDLQEIGDMFGFEVFTYVEGMTDISRPHHGNRTTRKATDRDHLKEAHYNTKTIKIADLIHNSESILKYDKDFSVVFMKEMFLLLQEDILGHGHRGLFNKARSIVNEYYLSKGENVTWDLR